MTEKAHEALAQGTVIKDRYKIVRLLGSGGMGAVYEARDQVLDKRVALKILHREIADDPQMNARFVQEARAASAFKHRNVVESLDFGAHNDAPFLVMEFLEGESFAELLEREQPLEPARALSLLEPIARALARAHQHGIIHRDVKPDNVFLARGDHEGECVPKLVDFGIAKRTAEGELRLTKTSVAMGTPFYMAPEQAMGAKDVTAAADQYAFAAMLYESVSGKVPHDGSSYNELIINKVTKDPAPLSSVKPEIPGAFAAVVMRALSRDPSARFSSMVELRDALVASLGGQVEAPMMTGPHPALPASSADRDAGTAPALPRSKLEPSLAVTVASGSTSHSKTPAATSAPEHPSAVPVSTVAGVERPSLDPTRGRQQASRGALILGGIVASMLVLGGVGLAMRKPPSSAQSASSMPSTQATLSPASRRLQVRVEPPEAVILVDGREIGRGSATFEAPHGRSIELTMRAEGRVTRVESLRLDGDLNLERVLEALPSATVARAVEPDASAASATRTTPSARVGRGADRPPPTVHVGGVRLGRTGVQLDLSLPGH